MKNSVNCSGLVLLALTIWVSSAFAQFDVPFTVKAEQQPGEAAIKVHFMIPPGHMIYADTIKVQGEGGATLTLANVLEPKKKFDELSGQDRELYDHGFDAVYSVRGASGKAVAIVVKYQGCSDSVCFFPQTLNLDVAWTQPTAPDATETEAQPTAAEQTASKPIAFDADWRQALDRFDIANRGVGYLGPTAFIAFLDKAEGHQTEKSMWTLFFDNPVQFLEQYGLIPTMLLILIGGFLLNLTPCVLPMIPINLAIIGAGAQAGSRARGFALGSVYGLAIALVYGALGLVVVLTNSQFGALNSSPWFNLVIAVIFVVLGLAMLDIIVIDLSRLNRASPPAGEQKEGGFLTALTMGSVAALLAGACVAPVLIAVLALSANLFSRGLQAGLALPFVLGLGMALPWPLAGAGLSFLPKPGKWMERVKVVFAIFIFILAGLYAWQAVRAFAGPTAQTNVEEGVINITNDNAAHELPLLLQEAHAVGQPVFIDFWATWCKSCKAMSAGTFPNVEVKKRLEPYLFIKYQAETLDPEPTRGIMQALGAKGLPAFYVLNPKKGGQPGAADQDPRAGALAP